MKFTILYCFISVILIGTGCHSEHHEELEESTFIVTSPLVKDTTIFQEYVCQIHSIQHIELRALERGYLKTVFIDEGQSVKKGQLLFQVMPMVYQAEVGKARAEASYAEIEYQNTKNLADKNIVSNTELALTKAKLDKANAELYLAETHLGFTEIRAPFDGIIGRFHVRVGSLLDEGEMLATLSDNSNMWVYFNVPEAEYLEYVSNTSLDSLPQVKLQMANSKFFSYLGIIETIEADFSNENGNIAFRATFPNPKGILRHSETGNIMMPIMLKKALLIPQKASFEILDKKFVYVVGKNNILELREIKVGNEMPHLYSIIEGLDEHDIILVDGLRKVKNKMKIKSEFVSLQKILADLNHLHAE